jgi:hypothetical protein
VSLEFLLTRFRLPNGGGIILLRSLASAFLVYLGVLGLHNALDSARTWSFSWPELTAQVRETFHWYGAIFGALYAGLYARFASQWTYLANVYNQIKAAECRRECNGDPLAEWKAGFMEDAEELHLATKPLFASVLRAWGGDANVKKKFIENAPGGVERFEALMKRVASLWEQTARQR